MMTLRPGSKFYCRFSTFQMPDRQNSALRLLASLLIYKPSRRATAATALTNTWLERAPTRAVKLIDNIGCVSS